jgi:hypothetical protein
VEGFQLMCETYPQVFLTGPQGSEFEVLLQEYVTHRSGEEGELVYLSAGILDETLLGDVIGMRPQGKDPTVIALKISSSIDLVSERQLLLFLENPAFKESKYVVCMEDFDPFTSECPYPETLRNRAKDSLFMIPYLNERLADVAHFTRVLMERNGPRGSERIALTPGAIDLLLTYPWPGNYHELKWTIEVLLAAPPRSRKISRERLEEVLVLGRTAPL